MLSHKLQRLKTFLDLAAHGQVTPNRGALEAAYRMAVDCTEQARQMEERVIPRRQRLTDEHLASGKVRVLGIIPRNEAFL